MIIASLPNHFHAKINIIESMYKLGELCVPELVDDL